MSSDIFEKLEKILEERKSADPEGSYVASLYKKGEKKIAQKIGEEAVELVIEAMRDRNDKIIEESADLLFHMMVLWAHRGLSSKDVLEVLEGRLGLSGIDEKNSRKKS